MEVKATRADAYALMHAGLLALSKAELQGIRIDVEYCRSTKQKLTEQIKELQEQFERTELAGIWRRRYGDKYNTNSDPQLSTVLYKEIGVKVAKTTDTGNGSTDEEALSQLKVPGLELLVRQRKLAKIRDTYLDSFEREQVGGVLHPFYNLHTVSTFRSSSNNPNFQNIPVRNEEAMHICRSAVYARPGNLLLEPDFKSLEVMIAACYHHDSRMLRYLRDPSSDMHADMAKQIFMLNDFEKTPQHKALRFAAKNGFVFPEFYGSYWKDVTEGLLKLAKLPAGRWSDADGALASADITLGQHFRSKGISSASKFEDHIKKVEQDFWGNRFPEYAEWKERWYARYQRRGFFDTLTGFRCSGAMRRNEVVNYPVQGSAFHCLLWTLIRVTEISEQEGWQSRIVGQIHDSMLIDTHPSEKEHVARTVRRVVVEELPAVWTWINVPLDVEMECTEPDASWATKKEYKIPSHAG